MPDLSHEAAVLALAGYAALREALPQMIRHIPALASRLLGRRAQDASARLTEAQAREAETRAEATSAATWAALTAELRSDLADTRARVSLVEVSDAECREGRVRDRAECQREYAALRDENHRTRQLVSELAQRLGARSTPSSEHSTMTEAVDPLAQTPRAGGTRVPLEPPAVPGAEDSDPTPDLHASKTPRIGERGGA